MAKEQINLHELEGKWQVILTNFPMWLKGDKKVRILTTKWPKVMAL